MNKLKQIAKDKRVITGIVVGVTIAFGVVLEPTIIDQIVNIISNIGS